jgi:hypothetical protein
LEDTPVAPKALLITEKNKPAAADEDNSVLLDLEAELDRMVVEETNNQEEEEEEFFVRDARSVSVESDLLPDSGKYVQYSSQIKYLLTSLLSNSRITCFHNYMN